MCTAINTCYSTKAKAVSTQNELILYNNSESFNSFLQMVKKLWYIYIIPNSIITSWLYFPIISQSMASNRN